MSFDLSNLNPVVQQVSKEKGVSPSAVINSIVQGVLSAVRKKYGTYRDIEVKYNKDLGDLELFEFKKVVKDEEFEDELIEIKYSEAKDLDPGSQIGDQIGTRLELKDLGRIDAQVAKQFIIQSLRSVEQEIIFTEFEKRKGEITNGVVRRVDPRMIVVDLEKTEAYIPKKEQIPGEKYKSGDRIQGYLLEVRQTTRGPQIIMSRAHEQYLIKLFEAEVPEVYEGIVKIVAAARDPGKRAKMSVYSTDPAVHPVGSCVGIKGSRVQNITQELKGERVDVIVWEEDPVQYICNALAPAKILKIVMDEDQKKMDIIVSNDQLSLAIGKRGQNVRLAVKLTGWDLNLVSEQEAKKAKEEALFNLSLLPDISETKVQSLFQYGYSHVKGVAEAELKELQAIPEFEKEKEAQKLLQDAKDLVEKYSAEGKEFPKMEETSSDKTLASRLKEQAEEILKRELAQLEEETAKKEVSEPSQKTSKGEASVSEKQKAESQVDEKTKDQVDKRVEPQTGNKIESQSDKETKVKTDVKDNVQEKVETQKDNEVEVKTVEKKKSEFKGTVEKEFQTGVKKAAGNTDEKTQAKIDKEAKNEPGKDKES